MTNDEKILNFINLEKPTTRQIIEVLKILAKRELKITDDGYELNSLTGKKGIKMNTKPTQIDEITDESIIAKIAENQLLKIKKELQLQIDTINEKLSKIKAE